MKAFIRNIKAHLWSSSTWNPDIICQSCHMCVLCLPRKSLSHETCPQCFLSPTHQQCHSRLSDTPAYSRQRQCFSAWGWWLSTRLCLGPRLGLSTTILTLGDGLSKVDFLGTPSLDVVCVLRNVQFRFLWNDHMNLNDQKGSRSSNFLIFFLLWVNCWFVVTEYEGTHQTPCLQFLSSCLTSASQCVRTLLHKACAVYNLRPEFQAVSASNTWAANVTKLESCPVKFKPLSPRNTTWQHSGLF